MNNICVSIFMLTYNQEEFISQAIEGVLMQETNFDYQLVIGEDCSTDITKSICETYARKFPGKIKLSANQKNIGLIQNFIKTFGQCTGKYIAICDGDDYWTDPLKLQKQVDFLENNPAYSIVFTGLKRLYPDGRLIEKNNINIKGSAYFEDLIFLNTIPSVTSLFRNRQPEDDIPRWINKFPYGDWPLYLWTIKDGTKIKYLDEVTAVYRKEIGVSEKLRKVSSDIARVNLEIVRCIYQDPQFVHKKEIIKKSLRKHQFALLANFFREKKFVKAGKLGSKLFLVQPKKVVRIYLYLIKRSFEKRPIEV